MATLIESLLHPLAGHTALAKQWGPLLGAALLLSLAGLLDVVTRLLLHLLYKRVRYTRALWDDAVCTSLKGPLQMAIWLAAAWGSIRLATPADAAWRAYLSNCIAILLTLIAAWFAMRLIRSLGHNLLARAARRDNKIDATTAAAIGKLLRAAVLVLTALIVLQALGVSLAGLLAFSGIGGIALGFAARDILANVFGGFTVYLNRPFAVGDWIRSPDRDIEGVVEDIGWRATTVRKFDMRPMYVPNAVFSNVAIENPSRMTHRRISATLPIRFEDTAAVPAIVGEVRDMLEQDDAIDNQQVILTYLDHMAESALELMIYCYTQTLDWSEYMAIKQSVLQRAQHIVVENGAMLAHPARTLHVPGEILVSRASAGGGDRQPGDGAQSPIDTGEVTAERREAVCRERQRQTGRTGLDRPAEDGE